LDLLLTYLHFLAPEIYQRGPQLGRQQCPRGDLADRD